MMNNTQQAEQNKEGGFYRRGKSFTSAEWAGMVATYERLLTRNYAAAAAAAQTEEDIGSEEIKVSVRELAREAKISKKSASKVIKFCRTGEKREEKPKGHGRRGIGSMKGESMT